MSYACWERAPKNWMKIVRSSESHALSITQGAKISDIPVCVNKCFMISQIDMIDENTGVL